MKNSLLNISNVKKKQFQENIFYSPSLVLSVFRLGEKCNEGWQGSTKQITWYAKLIYIILMLLTNSVHAQSFINLFNAGVAALPTDPESAIHLFEQALTLNPHSIETHYNIAYALKNLQRAEQAIAYYDLVLAKEPGNIGAHIGKAQACLMLGDYEQGWKELGWRLGHPDTYIQELIDYIGRNGSLNRKKILLRAEWGAGDTIMLIRYAQVLHAHGAYVIVHLLHESLVPLFKVQPYIDQVVGPREQSPAFHFQIPMMSLPRLCGTSIDMSNIPSPYLHIPDFIIKKWESVFERNYCHIGICWQGNIIHGQEKFMPLEYFALLEQLPGIKLYNLQQHHGLDQIAALKDPHILHTFDQNFDQIPFFDTAGVMHHLDLIITVDTSIAHLAGALGLPVWVILPKYADWRWMLDRTDSHWYPSMRLFRQKRLGDWESVINEVKHALITKNI